MVLLLAAIICFVLSVAGVAARVNLTSLGLAFFAASFLILT
jgi:hypothetical protein